MNLACLGVKVNIFNYTSSYHKFLHCNFHPGYYRAQGFSHVLISLQSTEVHIRHWYPVDIINTVKFEKLDHAKNVHLFYCSIKTHPSKDINVTIDCLPLSLYVNQIYIRKWRFFNFSPVVHRESSMSVFFIPASC